MDSQSTNSLVDFINDSDALGETQSLDSSEDDSLYRGRARQKIGSNRYPLEQFKNSHLSKPRAAGHDYTIIEGLQIRRSGPPVWIHGFHFRHKLCSKEIAPCSEQHDSLY